LYLQYFELIGQQLQPGVISLHNNPVEQDEEDSEYIDFILHMVLCIIFLTCEELAKPLVLPFQLSGNGYLLSGQAVRNQRFSLITNNF